VEALVSTNISFEQDPRMQQLHCCACPVFTRASNYACSSRRSRTTYFTMSVLLCGVTTMKRTDNRALVELALSKSKYTAIVEYAPRCALFEGHRTSERKCTLYCLVITGHVTGTPHEPAGVGTTLRGYDSQATRYGLLIAAEPYHFGHLPLLYASK
jgi:hypothetical protein